MLIRISSRLTRYLSGEDYYVHNEPEHYLYPPYARRADGTRAALDYNHLFAGPVQDRRAPSSNHRRSRKNYRDPREWDGYANKDDSYRVGLTYREELNFTDPKVKQARPKFENADEGYRQRQRNAGNTREANFYEAPKTASSKGKAPAVGGRGGLSNLMPSSFSPTRPTLNAQTYKRPDLEYG